jgi:HEAT repeat protein
MFNRFAILLAAALFFTPMVAMADGIVVGKTELVSILSGYHGAPGADYWARLDPAATPVTLKAIAEDESVFPIARSRALTALTYFADGSTADYLAHQAGSLKNAYLRASAYDAYGQAAGTAGVKTLANGLYDDDTMVRVMSSRALSRVGGKEAASSLRKAIASERNSTARSIMKKSLDSIQE